MKLKGDKVYLRATEPSDVDAIYEWENDPQHWLVSNTITPYSHHQIQTFIENDNDIFATHQMRLMIVNSEDQLVGCIDLYDFDPKNHRVGIGLLIDQEYRGQGYGSEALSLAVDYCFEMLDVHGLHADILASNASSRKLFEANGFQMSGVRKAWLWDGKAHVDQCFYQRLKQA